MPRLAPILCFAAGAAAAHCVVAAYLQARTAVQYAHGNVGRAAMTTPAETHFAYLWIGARFEQSVLENMAAAAAVIGPPRLTRPDDALALAIRFDATHPGFAKMYRRVPAVTQTDLARLLAVYYHGGVYLDADVVAHRPFLLAPNGTWFTEKVVADTRALGPREAPHAVRVANYAFGAPPGAPLVAVMLEEAFRRCALLIAYHAPAWSDNDIVWAAGPDVVTTVFHNTNGQGAVLFSKAASDWHVTHAGAGSWKSDTATRPVVNLGAVVTWAAIFGAGALAWRAASRSACAARLDSTVDAAEARLAGAQACV